MDYPSLRGGAFPDEAISLTVSILFIFHEIASPLRGSQ
jgi:hypothetical protein